MAFFWQNPIGTVAPNCGCRAPNDHTMADVRELRAIEDELVDLRRDMRGKPNAEKRYRFAVIRLSRLRERLAKTARR